MAEAMTGSARTRALGAEFTGTALLLLAVVGGGLAAAAGAPALQPGLAAGLTLGVLITVLGPVSGAHFNPAVSLGAALLGAQRWADALAYMAAQVAGGIVGVVAADALFGRAVLQVSDTARTGGALLGGELVATLVLVMVIFGLARSGMGKVIGVGVGAWISVAGLVLPSAFANPAVTVARSLTDGAAGIAPGSLAGYVVAQLAAAGLAAALVRWLFPSDASA
ncbi:MAG: aquaporin [Nitriliruptoraceae bacterium]